MPRGRKVSPEQIVVMLRQIEVQLAQGKSLALACKEAGIAEQSYYRWRREYGTLKLEQAKRLRNSSARTLGCAGLWPISRWRSRCSRTWPRETCKPRATPAGGSGHPGQVRPLGAPRLPDRQPAPRDPALRAHGPS